MKRRRSRTVSDKAIAEEILSMAKERTLMYWSLRLGPRMLARSCSHIDKVCGASKTWPEIHRQLQASAGKGRSYAAAADIWRDYIMAWKIIGETVGLRNGKK